VAVDWLRSKLSVALLRPVRIHLGALCALACA
jgi:hypothetical protein